MDFWKDINLLKKQTVDFIKREEKGKTIWGYGASTKGNTLLQWFGLDNTLIDGIAERSEAKYGLKTAGTNIPIRSEADMRKSKAGLPAGPPVALYRRVQEAGTGLFNLRRQIYCPMPPL